MPRLTQMHTDGELPLLELIVTHYLVDASNAAVTSGAGETTQPVLVFW